MKKHICIALALMANLLWGTALALQSAVEQGVMDPLIGENTNSPAREMAIEDTDAILYKALCTRQHNIRCA